MTSDAYMGKQGNAVAGTPGAASAVRIRPMALHEAAGVVALIRHCYGPTYFYQNLYCADKIAELNRSGAMQSIVAVNEADVIVGHMTIFNNETIGSVALSGKRDASRLGEPAMLMVRSDHRSQGILARMMALALAPGGACARDLEGLFCPPVTDHVYSQRAMYQYGFLDCGYLLDYYPPAHIVGLSADAGQRTSLVLTYLARTSSRRRHVYPPARHARMVMDTIAYLGDEAVLGEPHRYVAHAETVVQTSIAVNLGNACIKILRCGRDVRQCLVREMGMLRGLRIEAVLLYLSLNDPATAVMADDVETLGFHFAGVLPGTTIGDALILQYVAAGRATPPCPALASARARQIFAYVRKSIDERIGLRRHTPAGAGL